MAKTLFFLLLLGYGLLVSPAIAQEAVPDSVIAHKSRWAVRNSFWYAYTSPFDYRMGQYHYSSNSLSELLLLSPCLVYRIKNTGIAGGFTYTGAGWVNNPSRLGPSAKQSVIGRVGLLLHAERYLLQETRVTPVVLTAFYFYYKQGLGIGPSPAMQDVYYDNYFFDMRAGVGIRCRVWERFVIAPAYTLGILIWKRNYPGDSQEQQILSENAMISIEYLLK